jgi:hypothetical protein
VADGLPDKIRVKLSTEDAGAVTLTPVVVREMPLGELVELMLDVAGKNVARLQELLRRGVLVSGASRYRWAALEASNQSLETLLAGFPDPEPERPFAAAHCVEVRLEGERLRSAVPRAALARKRLFRTRSFWDVLVACAADAGVRYSGYSYREHADRYRLEIPPEQSDRMKASADLLRYSTLEAHVRNGDLRSVEFSVRRG